jgi:crossover junction endodeoxyribonuclease RuvC
MAIILGIDPGLQKTGWGIIKSNGSNLSFIACGTIKTNAAFPIEQRLAELHKHLSQVITLYTPEQAAIEETFVNNNPISSLKLGQARGALILSLSMAGLPVSEYAPNLIKKTVVGVGRAEKQQIEAMIKILLPGSKTDGADSADALAVAICHASYARNNIY